jgi:hypothetical protein
MALSQPTPAPSLMPTPSAAPVQEPASQAQSLPTPTPATANYDPFTGLYSYAAGVPQIRFIAFDEIDEERRKSIAEDSQVLHHLLTQGIPRAKRVALGVNIQSQAGANCLYVEDRGLVLTYVVNQMVAEDESESKAEEAEEQKLTPWEEAKRELQGSRSPFGARKVYDNALLPPDGSYNFYGTQPGPAGTYDAEFIESLDNAVTEALQQIGNFRGLAKDDTVTVFVYGVGNKPDRSNRSVYAWRVNVSDVDGDQGVSSETIDRRQYFESAPGPGGPTLYSTR